MLSRTMKLIALASTFVAMLATGAWSQTTLRLNSQWPATTAGSKVDQWFADEIGKRTNGEVKIQIFWSEALGKANENLSLMQNGAVDMGAMSAGYFPTQLPLHAAPNSIPMAMDTVEQASELMKRLATEVPGFAKEAKDNGVRALFFHHLNPYLLVSKEPITAVSQMQGKRMRTWGTDMPRMVQAAGGVPVTLSLPEIYEGLSRGVIDTAPFSVDLVDNYKIYEVAKHVSEITLWLGPSWGVWISERAWQRLSPEHQKIFMQVSDEARARDLEATKKAQENARKVLAERGVKFHDFPAAEKTKWRGAMPDFFADLVTRMEAQGKGDDARQAVKIWREVAGR
ncbi:MAG: C4-dicarboxylate TRAP transporter substrate-binding protein [Hyphomicrobiaceae bacterium]|nr:C4-dicarboxylate TRAP transporter substrate-binding protein [Hyphomicrobiaceae bacterium]